MVTSIWRIFTSAAREAVAFHVRFLGKDYAGGLIVDCYSGYDRHATKIKQRCVPASETHGEGLAESDLRESNRIAAIL